LSTQEGTATCSHVQKPENLELEKDNNIIPLRENQEQEIKPRESEKSFH